MNTAFLLLAQYNGRAIISVEDLCRDYFQHLSPEKFIAKIYRGEIALPLVRLDPDSQKTTKGVHLADLAEYLDRRVEAARKEYRQLNGI